MRIFLLAIALMASLPISAYAQLVISNDPGGMLSQYQNKYEQVAQSGERIVIDGPCLSACTLLTAQSFPVTAFV